MVSSVKLSLRWNDIESNIDGESKQIAKGLFFSYEAIMPLYFTITGAYEVIIHHYSQQIIGHFIMGTIAIVG